MRHYILHWVYIHIMGKFIMETERLTIRKWKRACTYFTEFISILWANISGKQNDYPLKNGNASSHSSLSLYIHTSLSLYLGASSPCLPGFPRRTIIDARKVIFIISHYLLAPYPFHWSYYYYYYFTPFLNHK